MPASPQIEPPPKKSYKYRLSENDRRFLKSLLIAQDVPPDVTGPSS